jgi:hypothetical protein
MKHELSIWAAKIRGDQDIHDVTTDEALLMAEESGLGCECSLDPVTRKWTISFHNGKIRLSESRDFREALLTALHDVQEHG